MKKAITYKRYSHDGQSLHSIERQDIVINGWLTHQQISVVDSFTDEGHTARNFDRPDMKALMAFIKKNHRHIDYLVVAELTRFSREAGDAINMVKLIQNTYGILIVSAGRGMVYDVFEHSSFLMMGLEFLLGNSENIKRTADINGGIYAAKTSGRWIQGGPAPYGYKKEGAGKDKKLVIYEPQAVVIRYIFNSFLHNAPIYLIKDDAKKMGMPLKGNNAVHDILKNPLYMSQQYVKAWKDKPGGLYPLKDVEPIIPESTWYEVQEKFKPRPRVSLSYDFPLRQIVKCWCGLPLTGAPSRSKSGKYFNYYKCKISGHNTINAGKAHAQLEEMLKLLSLPNRISRAIETRTMQLMDERIKDVKAILVEKKSLLEQTEAKLHSSEEKFISNQLSFESYDKWTRELRQKRSILASEVNSMERDTEQTFFLLKNNLHRLTDLCSIYTTASLTDKRELLRQVFDNRLYYRTKVYRTPFLMPVFHHNIQILSEKQLLILDTMNKNSGEVEATSLLSNTFLEFLSFIGGLKVA